MASTQENRMLVEQYPFLLPPEDDCDYSWTLLDEMPNGWRQAFGAEMLAELREILIHADFLEQYCLCQIKEKFGVLRWQSLFYTLYLISKKKRGLDILYRMKYNGQN